MQSAVRPPMPFKTRKQATGLTNEMLPAAATICRDRRLGFTPRFPVFTVYVLIRMADSRGDLLGKTMPPHYSVHAVTIGTESCCRAEGIRIS